MATLQELLMGKMMDAVTEGAQSGSKHISAMMKQQGDREAFDQLKAQNPKARVKVGDYSIEPHENDGLSTLLKFLTIKNLQDERDRKAVQDLEDRSTKAGTAPAVEALKRAEGVVPGISEGKANYKSIGGIKNLVPNALVTPLEKVGLFDKGSADERAALQELANTKIYDSSGKQTNENEMKRINDAMGIRGMFDSSATNQAMAQFGNTVLQKQNQVTAGATPSAVQTFKSRGGLAGFKTLGEMLGKPSSQEDQEKAELEQLRAKHKR